jgi:hypothetical protein
MPDFAVVWVVERSRLLHAEFFQHSRRGVCDGQRMRIDGLYLRVRESIVN